MTSFVAALETATQQTYALKAPEREAQDQDYQERMRALEIIEKWLVAQRQNGFTIQSGAGRLEWARGAATEWSFVSESGATTLPGSGNWRPWLMEVLPTEIADAVVARAIKLGIEPPRFVATPQDAPVIPTPRH